MHAAGVGAALVEAYWITQVGFGTLRLLQLLTEVGVWDVLARAPWLRDEFETLAMWAIIAAAAATYCRNEYEIYSTAVYLNAADIVHVALCW